MQSTGGREGDPFGGDQVTRRGDAKGGSGNSAPLLETFELSPDGRRSIATFRSLEAAIEQAQAMLSSR